MAESVVHAERNCETMQHQKPSATTAVPEDDFGKSVLQNEMLAEILWACFLFMIVEYVVLWLQGKRLPLLHHNIASLTHIIFYMTVGLLLHGAEYAAYVWVWRNYALFSYPSSSVVAFVLTVIAIDFGYYWFHRAGHELSILWAFHQVHHSSDEYTITVGLRHSPIQKLYIWVAYLPLAVLGIPPLHLVFHLHYNILFQVWTHTYTVDTLGPLEYILNTPNHHRIHHGTNTPYLDKNYGGLLIIWDRIFGTFQEKDPNRKTNYGNVYTPKTIELIHNQYYYIIGIVNKAITMSCLKDFLLTFIKGPAWTPGSPWTGNRDPNENNDRPKHTVSCGYALHLYVMSHLLSIMVVFSYLDISKVSSMGELLVCVSMIIATLSSIGRLYDNLEHARAVEFLRCVFSVCFMPFLPPALPEAFRYWFFYHHIVSIPFCFWSI